MIQDSIPWKEELLKVADRLEAKSVQKRWTERSSFLVERDIMMSAYAIRKLMESYKVSDQLRQRQIPVKRYNLKGSKVPDVIDKDEFWDLYDLENEHHETLTIPKLCNQIVHSWVWSLSCDCDSSFLDGFYVSSDLERKKKLFLIAITDLISLCRDIGNEDIYSWSYATDKDGQMIHTAILGRPYVQPVD